MARKISKERVGEYMKSALTEIHVRGGSGRFGEIARAIAPNLYLSEYELEVNPNSNNLPRWQKQLHFYSIDMSKAGWLFKQDRLWFITADGISKLNLAPLDLYEEAVAAYRRWKAENPKQGLPDPPEGDEDDEQLIEQFAIGLEQAQDQSFQEISDYILAIDAYGFQDLVGELLRGMGYYVRLIADRGRDGGIDIIAYQDALGFSSPRMKVQVKHRKDRVDVKEVREFDSLLRKAGDVGLIVSTGGFTSPALDEIRLSTHHIETMDLNRFIDLWQSHWESIPQAGKVSLPLTPVYFLALET